MSRHAVLGKPRMFTRQSLMVFVMSPEMDPQGRLGHCLIIRRSGVFHTFKRILTDEILTDLVVYGDFERRRLRETAIEERGLGLYVWDGMVTLGSEGGQEFRGKWRLGTDVECLDFAHGKM